MWKLLALTEALIVLACWLAVSGDLAIFLFWLFGNSFNILWEPYPRVLAAGIASAMVIGAALLHARFFKNRWDYPVGSKLLAYDVTFAVIVSVGLTWCLLVLLACVALAFMPRV